MSNKIFNWRCPSCHKSLVLANNQWRCENRHSFDSANEGYVNLLLAQHKKSKDPGDNKGMVASRRAFLTQNHYQALANKLADVLYHYVLKNRSEKSPLSLLDAGCGEGYYVANILNTLAATQSDESQTNILVSGIDISKPAIQKAARKYKSTALHNFRFAVASCFNLPVLDQSQNVLMQIFAPAKQEEVARVLNENGMWIQVDPASDHLYELKSMVYDKPAKHQADYTIPSGFKMLTQQELRFTVSLSKPIDRQNLLMMTPFYWTISELKKQQLLDELKETQAHFQIRVLQKD